MSSSTDNSSKVHTVSLTDKELEILVASTEESKSYYETSKNSKTNDPRVKDIYDERIKETDAIIKKLGDMLRHR